jgi:cysteine-rich repeat protein
MVFSLPVLSVCDVLGLISYWEFDENSGIDIGDTCDATDNGDGCSSTCSLEPLCSDSTKWIGCGDGNTIAPEECDDDRANGDGCSAVCKNEVCGDGIVQPNGLDGIPGNADDEECEPALYANCGAVGAANDVRGQIRR